MSVTFVIGNGFDLNCGLKSSFIDVCDDYCFDNETNSITIKRLKENIRRDIKTWADFEMEMAKYASELDSEEEFMECIEDFTNFLTDYLIKEEKVFFNNMDNYSNKAKIIIEFKESINGFYKGLTNNIVHMVDNKLNDIDVDVNVVSLNYTKTFERILKLSQLSINNEIIHVHGYLDDGIVLGVDNESQISNLKFELTKDGKRYFIKPYLNEEYDKYRVDKTKEYINESDYICVFGASLGESDLTLRNEIKEWLLEDSERLLFIYDYNYYYASNKNKAYTLRIEEKAREEYAKKFDIANNEEAKNRINVMIGKNIFNFKELLMEDNE